ncbi:MAG: hypothetical protein SFV19_06550 [Rhodospirillaceae bacterium]|nr:hypothetical protein [Rhodospirillaceae bacterium]
MEKAINIMEEPALNGDGLSAYRLGTIYRDGRVIDKDTDMAIAWLNVVPPTSAEGPAASYALACTYFGLATVLSANSPANLIKIRISKADAFWAMHSAAEAGHFLAQVDLAAYYRFGYGTEVDQMAPELWIRQAKSTLERHPSRVLQDFLAEGNTELHREAYGLMWKHYHESTDFDLRHFNVDPIDLVEGRSQCRPAGASNTDSSKP